MAVEIKFCGMTRREDVAHAVALGAAYVGVIFAGGPRNRTVEQAAELFADVPESTRRVGVFAGQSADEICAIAGAVGLDTIQLHAGSDAERVAELRRCFSGDVWSVIRLASEALPVDFSECFAAADAVLLDAMKPGSLGGTGATLPWSQIAEEVQRARGDRRLVLAGGLRPENVASAVATLSPDVVDVSSGVESAPGVKNHDRMRAFCDAVAEAGRALKASRSS